MSENFEELLELAAAASFDKEVLSNANKVEHDFIKVNLVHRQQIDLTEKILSLPPKGMFVLFAKYCFHLTPAETEIFFQIENSNGYLLYYLKLLGMIMGLSEGQLISDEIMKQACKAALIQYLKKEFYVDKQIGLSQHRNKVGLKKLAKKIAVAAIIATMSFSTIMVANAEFREKVISWMILTFEKYSIFELKNDNDSPTMENLQKYIPSYIPDGFQLDNTIAQPNLILFEYSNESSDTVDVLMCISNTKVYMDTEGISIEELNLQSSKGYYFNKDGENYIIFEKEGFHFEVFGSINKEELISIAEGIVKK